MGWTIQDRGEYYTVLSVSRVDQAIYSTRFLKSDLPYIFVWIIIFLTSYVFLIHLNVWKIPVLINEAHAFPAYV